MKLAFLIPALFAASVSTSALAAGSDSSEPPAPTQTTKTCKKGKVWDKKTKKCLKVKASLFSDDTLYEAAREMAYAGQYDHAMNVLDVAANQNDPRILNYKGFVNRKQGNTDKAMNYYQAALKINPDYILARSYMGQGLVASGKLKEARAQLQEIEARGGRNTWAYAALDKALMGQMSDY